MSTRLYALVITALLILACVVGTRLIPYSPESTRFVLPILVATNSMPWLVSRRGKTFKAFSLVTSAVVVWLGLTFALGGGRDTFPLALSVLFVILIVHASFLLASISDRDLKILVAIQLSSVAMVFVLAVLLTEEAVASALGHTSLQLLFLPPLLVTIIAAGSTITGWNRWKEILALAGVAQVGNGFMDLAGTAHQGWAAYVAFLFWLPLAARLGYLVVNRVRSRSELH